MCGNDHREKIWTLRDRQTGAPYESAQGFRYSFDTEDEAREFLEENAPAADVEIVEVRIDATP